ncbi:MAG: hypothetical protein JST44_08405 [Cyanobacteria bacterium SZAS LIN-5]|nr:hypothetical protein [Cyanobacteria bacterium SZAS LIN-5]
MNKITRAQEEELTRQSLERFFAVYPDEKSCLEVFPANCKSCGIPNEEAHSRGERSFDCTNCKRTTWRTAGTYFHGLRYLHPTFALIWTAEERAVLSAYKLTKLFKIVYATAWETVERLQTVFEEEMENHDVFELVSTVFNPAICKRSNLCVGGEHPDFVEEDDEPDPEDLKDLNDDQVAVCTVLKSRPISFDQLYKGSGLPIARFAAAIGSLDLMGIAKFHGGNRYSLIKTNPILQLSREEKAILKLFFEYVKNFHGISRKYLQRYIASFWARYWPRRWPESSLLRCCMKYVSPTIKRVGYNSSKLIRVPIPS